MATWILIIFIIAVALAPLSHFVPSKRQRQVAGLREHAALSGLFVEFRSLPARPGVNTDKAVSTTALKRQVYTDGILFYGRRQHRRDTPRQAWMRAGRDWQPTDRQGPEAPPLLAELPSAVIAASIDREAVGVYWREEGSVDDVTQIGVVLEQLCAAHKSVG